MRTRQTTAKSKNTEPKVYCCNCQRCKRDTDGPSKSAITGEYFMGLCPLGHADGRIFYDESSNIIGGKVFMDKARVCKDIKPKTQQQ